MPRISQLSTEAPASTSDLVLNVGSTTRRANVQQILSVPVTAQGDMLFGDSSADSTRLAPPTSGAILAYSSASSAPSWSIPTSGAVLVASSVGTPVWRAIGTSGQILESTGGTPTWVANVDPSTGHITTAGTSGQILQTTVGAAAWVNTTAVLAETLTAAGDMLIRSTAGVERLAQPTSGAVLTFSTVNGTSRALWSIPTSGAVLVASSVGTPVWRAIGTSGQILESTGGTPTWVTQAGVGTTEVWVLTKDTSQAFASTGTWTTVNWKVDEIDTDNFHSTATSAAEVNIRVAGTYLMGVIVNLEPNATGSRQLRILEGSTMIIRTEQDPSTIGASGLQAHVVRNFGTSGITLTVEVLTEGSTAAITAGSGLDAKWWGHRISA